MSSCSCDPDGKTVRVSGEGLWRVTMGTGPDGSRRVTGGAGIYAHTIDWDDPAGPPQSVRARLRCSSCGGKAGFIPVAALFALGWSKDEILESVEPGTLSGIVLSQENYTAPTGPPDDPDPPDPPEADDE